MMNTIRNYNEHLNASYPMETKFKQWSEYRKTVTNLCLQQGPLKGGIAIFGAGYLNDIELNALLNGSTHLTLVDCDGAAMEKGLAHQKYKGVVKEQVLDLTGLDSENFFDELTVLMTYKDIVGIERYLDELVFKESTLFAKDSFDVILISPMYTQLILPQFMDLVAFTEMQEHMARLTEAILKFLARLIESLNKALLSVLKLGGLCIAWSDIVEYSIDDKTYAHLEKTEAGLKRHVLDYEEQYGLGLGSYGLLQLSQEFDNEREMQENWLIWPFDEDRHLITKMVQGIK